MFQVVVVAGVVAAVDVVLVVMAEVVAAAVRDEPSVLVVHSNNQRGYNY